MKETCAFAICPVCNATLNLTGSDIGNAAMISLPVHKGTLDGEPRDMEFSESINDPETCDMSELLVYVDRPVGLITPKEPHEG